MCAVFSTRNLELPLNRFFLMYFFEASVQPHCANHRKHNHLFFKNHFPFLPSGGYNSLQLCSSSYCVCVRVFFFFLHQRTNLIDRSRSLSGNKHQGFRDHCNWDEVDPFCCCMTPLLHSGPSNDPTLTQSGMAFKQKVLFLGTARVMFT